MVQKAVPISNARCIQSPIVVVIGVVLGGKGTPSVVGQRTARLQVTQEKCNNS